MLPGSSYPQAAYAVLQNQVPPDGVLAVSPAVVERLQALLVVSQGCSLH